MRYKGGTPPLMIYTLTHDDIPLLSQWIKNRQVETCRFLAGVAGDVASASGGRKSERKEAPRSTSEIRQYRVVGHRKRKRTLGSNPIDIKISRLLVKIEKVIVKK